MQHYRMKGKAESSTQSAINANILPTLGTIELLKLSSKKIGDWHHQLAKKPAMLRTKRTAEKPHTRSLSDDPEEIRRRHSSANRTMTILKAALNFAWKNGRVANDASWRKVEPFENVDAPIIRHLKKEECARLVNACPEDLRNMVKAALFTGCRYGELTKLTVADFNIDAGKVAIRTSKSGKPRHVVLTDEGRAFFAGRVAGKKGGELIFTHTNGTAWGKSHQSKPLIEACKNGGISPAISFHILRHTHGSLLAMQGVPLPVIAQQLGHADTRMTEKHYAHLSHSYVADTIRQHFPTLGLGAQDKVLPLGSSTQQARHPSRRLK